MNVGRRSHRLGWDGNGGSLPALTFTETAAGSLGIPEDELIGESPVWKWQFFTIPGVFNRPDVIRNAGGGAIQVLQSGLYMLNAYITTANSAGSSNSNVRFVRNFTEEISNSDHQIYEDGTHSDRDMLAKGVPVLLNAGDLITCQLNSNRNDQYIEALSNWTIELKSGLVGAAGPAGTYTPPDPYAFRAYRTANSPTDVNVQGTAKNVFANADLSISCTEQYDENNDFDPATGLWTPAAGKYLVSAGTGTQNQTDTSFTWCMLYNVTAAAIVNWGFLGRNEANSGFCNSTLSCQISANGTDVYGLYVQAINDTSVGLLGGQEQTFFSAFRFTGTP